MEVACEARGGYPTTYDTDGIDVAKRFLKRHAIFLAGGDVYGLDSPIGIRKYLLEKGTVSKSWWRNAIDRRSHDLRYVAS